MLHTYMFVHVSANFPGYFVQHTHTTKVEVLM